MTKLKCVCRGVGGEYAYSRIHLSYERRVYHCGREGRGNKGKLPLSLQLRDQKHGPAVRHSSLGWCGQGYYCRIDGFYRDLHYWFVVQSHCLGVVCLGHICDSWDQDGVQRHWDSKACKASFTGSWKELETAWAGSRWCLKELQLLWFHILSGAVKRFG